MTIEISGWDYTVSPCATQVCPVFYVLPDDTWVSYTRINGYLNIPVLIEGTGLYDGIHWIRVDQQPQTLWNMGFLTEISFNGYPPYNGRCTIYPSHGETDLVSEPLACIQNGCC